MINVPGKQSGRYLKVGMVHCPENSCKGMLTMSLVGGRSFGKL